MVQEQLIQLLKCILNQLPVCDCKVLPADWERLIALAKRHNVANLLGYAAELASEPSVKLQLRDLLVRGTVISNGQLHAARQLQQCFEEKGIYHMALKGINTKQYYPQPDMRTMGDLDVLCKPEQQVRIRAAMESLGFTDFQEGRKHDHYKKPPFVGVEIHRELVAADSPYSAYYADIWQRCQPKAGCVYTYEMSVTDGFIYNIIHLAEHLKEGGAGVRFIMDVYVYNHLEELDRTCLQEELTKLGLWELFGNAARLADHWFAVQPPELDEKQQDLLRRFGAFILAGGVFGTKDDEEALGVQKSGRLLFLLRSCFPGYREMRSMFPWLRRWPILLPYSWALRGIRSLIHRRENVKSRFSAYRNADADRGRALRKLYVEIGLRDL